mmetsp:Transcript_9934/g.14971  ORF Transcript_9934/g.14971 Transcript_9934/m.14971 type:complete len:153 (+) Transcript_9934:124-582(+)|eukprot:CAMPEP_0194075556 /NCGR_PEP_ID=MMETSP0149-20130528/2541_1 /TAXON_ID=122233 /ORGANISM="Chaetoceros debilis, Strain MM31A-1" /LENGTH=152 /DNA_ID=CAMNT_0038756071 /DNA_START=129 /DNA_END=587 /DNA_ORIENTATION=-
MNMISSLLILGILTLHLGISSAFAFSSSSHRQQSLAISHRTSRSSTCSDLMRHRHYMHLYATPPTDDDGDIGSDDKTDDSNSNSSPFAKINSFLDTPILDANNKSDQGVVAEALKDFVRDEPQLAQIAFSGVVVVLFFVGVRIFNAIVYGGF